MEPFSKAYYQILMGNFASKPNYVTDIRILLSLSGAKHLTLKVNLHSWFKNYGHNLRV